MLEADAAAELLGELAAWEIGRALLMTTTISSPVRNPSATDGSSRAQAVLLTHRSHSLRRLCFQNVDAFRD